MLANVINLENLDCARGGGGGGAGWAAASSVSRRAEPEAGAGAVRGPRSVPLPIIRGPRADMRADLLPPPCV